jgi:hypothetical protein
MTQKKPTQKRPAAKKPVAKKPTTKKPIAKKAATRPPARAARKRGVASQKPAPASIELKPIVGLSTELGVLVAVSTDPKVSELGDFRLAVKEPYPRAVSAARSKCRVARAVIRDPAANAEIAVYVAFIPVPSRTAVVGNVFYRTKLANGAEVFFTAGTQAVEKVESQQLAKILLVLEKAFEQILPEVFAPDHFLSKTFAALVEKRNAVELWKASQAKVEEFLKANQGKEALAVLEPLVYQKTPHAQAEKLLGDLLWRAYMKDKPEQPTAEATRQFTTERLLFQYLLKVAGPSA